MKSYSNKLVKSSRNVLLFLFLSAIIGYLFKFIIARKISVEDIGLFYSVLGFITFFVFLRDFGRSDSFVYYLPRLKLENNKGTIKQI